MATLDVLTSQGESAGYVEVADSLVACEINLDAVRQCVNAFLANQRQGTHKTKGRSDVRGGGAKPWRQKGTGRARAGTNRSPLWRGGGVIFGPQPRSYRKKVNRKVRQNALRSVLTDKFESERLKVLEKIELSEGRLSEIREMMGQLEVIGKTLIITEKVNPLVLRAAGNLPGLTVQVVNSLNVYDMLDHDNLLVTSEALRMMEEMWA